MSIPGYYNSLSFTSNKANLYSSKADWKLNKTESPVEPVETLLCLTQGGSDSAWGLGSGRGQTAFLTNCQVNRRLPVGEPTWRTTIWTDIRGRRFYTQSPEKVLLLWAICPQNTSVPNAYHVGSLHSANDGHSWVLPWLLEALDSLPWEGNSFPHYAGKRESCR